MTLQELPFGRRIKQQRRALDLTQDALATMIGCSGETIRKLEAGGLRPSRQLAELLAGALAVPPAEQAAFVALARSSLPLETPAGLRHNASVGPTIAGNLPPQLTPLLGRDQELAACRDLLRRQEVRLLTLTGAGGSGKTRLAVGVAAVLLGDFSAGVYFANLAPLSAPRLVTAEIAQTLGLTEAPGQPLIDSLKAFLREKQVLLVLDNFEHLLDAAPTVSELLGAASRLKVLVTSRAPLRLRGEKEFAVPPLELPDLAKLPPADRLIANPAVRLFVERASDVKPGFALSEENAPAVAAICVQVDGLPLAIELAAARVRLFQPPALLARLASRLALLTGGAHDLPARQQTLRASIEWSYDLLADGEKTLFRRLAVFSGGSTLEALAPVCNYDGRLKVDMLQLVDSLVAKGLLVQQEGLGGEPRFVLLKTIEEYAAEQLLASGELEMLGAEHAGYFASLAAQASPMLRTRQRAAWLVRLAAEHDNLSAALAWADSRSDEGDIELRLVSGLFYYWLFRSNLSEGGEWQERALAQPASRRYPRLRAECLWQAAALASLRGEDAGALMAESLELLRELGARDGLASALFWFADVFPQPGTDTDTIRAALEESVAICRELGEQWGLALALTQLGWWSTRFGEAGDAATAGTYLEESRAIFGALDDTWGLSSATEGLAQVSLRQGDTSRSLALHQDALALVRQSGNRWLEELILGGLGTVSRVRGDTQQSVEYFAEQLALAREIGDKGGAAATLHTLGYLALEQGDPSRAKALCEESLALASSLGQKSNMAWALRNLGRCARSQGDNQQAIARVLESMNIFLEISGREGVAVCLFDLADLLSAKQPLAAARLVGAADKMLEGMRWFLSFGDAGRFEQTAAELRNQLGEEGFAAASAEGADLGLTPEQAVAAAIALVSH